MVAGGGVTGSGGRGLASVTGRAAGEGLARGWRGAGELAWSSSRDRRSCAGWLFMTTSATVPSLPADGSPLERHRFRWLASGRLFLQAQLEAIRGAQLEVLWER